MVRRKSWMQFRQARVSFFQMGGSTAYGNLFDSDVSEERLIFCFFFQPKLKFRIINTVSDELDLLELETSTN